MFKVVHLIDDSAVGGVMVALENFQDDRLQRIARSATVEVNPERSEATAFDADIIIVHFTISWRKLPFLTALRLRNWKRKIIIVEHTYTKAFEAHNVPDRTRFRFMLRLAYGLCDKVIAVSQGQAGWLKLFCPQRKLVAIPQSRPLNDYFQCSVERDSPHRPLTFGAIGRYHQQKGFDILAKAFRAAKTKNAVLKFAGYGPEYDALKEVSHSDPTISFVGLVDEPITFYRSVDVIIVPSRWEAFGLVATEAMAAGCYVIVADVDGLPEQVRGFGAIFCPQNQEALRLQIEAIVAAGKPPWGSNQRRHAAQAARARYCHLISQWCDLFENVVDASKLKVFDAQEVKTSPNF